MRGLTAKQYEVLTTPNQSIVFMTVFDWEELCDRGLLIGPWDDFGITDMGKLAARVSEQALGI